MIGAGAFVFFKLTNTNSTPEPRAPDFPTQKTNTKRRVQDDFKPPNPVSKVSENNTKVPERKRTLSQSVRQAAPHNKKTLLMLSKTEKLLRREFNFYIDRRDILKFEKTTVKGLEKNANEYDIAIKYILIMMNNFEISELNNSVNFIEKNTNNISRVLKKCSLPKADIISTLNKIRDRHSLNNTD